MYCNCLSESCKLEVFSIIESCLNFHSNDEFESILKRTRELMGYEMMACGIGIRDGRSMKAVTSLNKGFPEKFISMIVGSSGQVISPLFCHWFESQSPQVLDVHKESCQSSSDDIAFYQRFSINNVMSHGVLDCGQGYASYFGFANIVGGIEERHVDLMKILVPHLHAVYTKTAAVKKALSPIFPVVSTLQSGDLSDQYLVAQAEVSHNKKILSARETEVLRWVYLGKTNWEVAQVLSISEQTVKNHVKKITKKLDVNNRQHATAKALQMKIIVIQ
ncbi:MAG: LuxR C-terminal-related transcriptional regulator [Gammaproteobacteria bacterium]|nr:LuxR C-terminal-related transcriptional regulator [Gammaproteobacteria bacterium]